ncbi:MAG: HAMP domain-containing histidine kinase [Ramlibacter sp.]|nr:HAMP domain-containing histidine kinase [Ramlibacter sp.]
MIGGYGAAAWLVAAGLGVFLALLWLRAGARRRHHVLDDLLALRRVLERDPLQGLEQAGMVVRRLGLAGLQWDGEWYGAPVAGVVGKPPGSAEASVARMFAQPDVTLNLRVSLHGMRGEARLFAVQSAHLLFAIVDGALAARELALVSAMTQRARVAVFMQHDLRNLVQWIELIAEDVQQAPTPEEALRIAQRIRQGAALAHDRARRIAGALLRPDDREAPPSDEWRVLDVAADLAQAAQLHQVALDLEMPPGQAPSFTWSAQAWATVLDNVLGNVSRLARERMVPARCRVRINRRGQDFSVSFETPDLPLEMPILRLFEPWSGTRPGGTGLGLYQARRAALAAGADLRAQPCDKGLSVTLCVNCKNS